MAILAHTPIHENTDTRGHPQSYRLYDCALVGGLTLIAILAALPFSETAFDDDWSYSHAALVLARTGQFRYDGWMTSVGFFQTGYGALLISLFGFSFNLLRLATAPFAMGCAVLTYLLSRKTGILRSASILIALTLTLSPFFIPLAASFMTDVYGCFFTLLCLYFGVLALASEADWTGIIWLGAATAAGIAGATTRQSVWPALIAVLVCVGYVRRGSRLVLAVTIGLSMIAGSTAVVVQRWFAAQPNSHAASAVGGTLAKLIGDPIAPIILTIGFFLTLALYAVPAMLSFWPAAWRLPKSKLLVIMMMVLAFTALLAALGESAPVAPWIGNIVTRYGLLYKETDLLGAKPVILPFAVRLIVTAAVFFSIGLWLPIRKISVTPPTAMLALFTLGYGALIAVRACSGPGFVFDRYAVPVIPVLLILILGTSDLLRVPLGAWIALGLFALFGIAMTHDYYAQLRARSEAETELRAAGISRTHWTAGFENDAWRQLELRGYVRNVESSAPSGDSPGDPALPVAATRGQTLWWFSKHAPGIDPVYFIVYAPVPGLTNTSFAPAAFTTWMPPAKRYLLIQRLPGK